MDLITVLFFTKVGGRGEGGSLQNKCYILLAQSGVTKFRHNYSHYCQADGEITANVQVS
jgi:hypothetical protein